MNNYTLYSTSNKIWQITNNIQTNVIIRRKNKKKRWRTVKISENLMWHSYINIHVIFTFAHLYRYRPIQNGFVHEFNGPVMRGAFELEHDERVDGGRWFQKRSRYVERDLRTANRPVSSQVYAVNERYALFSVQTRWNISNPLKVRVLYTLLQMIQVNMVYVKTYLSPTRWV